MDKTELIKFYKKFIAQHEDKLCNRDDKLIDREDEFSGDELNMLATVVRDHLTKLIDTRLKYTRAPKYQWIAEALDDTIIDYNDLLLKIEKKLKAEND